MILFASSEQFIGLDLNIIIYHNAPERKKKNVKIKESLFFKEINKFRGGNHKISVRMKQVQEKEVAYIKLRKLPSGLILFGVDWIWLFALKKNHTNNDKD